MNFIVLQWSLFLLLLSTTFGIAQVTDITQCATTTSNPNVSTFDLTVQDNVILNGMDAATHVISYYEDANAETTNNALANPASYTNTSNPQTIYARNTNTNDGTYTVSSFNLIVDATIAAPTAYTPLQYCSPDNNTLADVIPQITSGTNIIFWDAATGGNQLAETTPLTDNMTVWISQGISPCAARLMIEIQVEQTTTAVGCPAGNPLLFCSSTTPTLADVTPQLTGSNIVYWNDAYAGLQLAETTPLTNNMTVWASQGTGGCAVRTQIEIQLLTPVAAPTLDTTPIQLAENATIADLTSNVTGQNLMIWNAASGGNQLDTTTPLACNMHIWFSQGPGSCTSRLEIAITCQTDTNGNTTYSCARIGGTAGVNTVVLHDIKISPNPSTGIVNMLSENRNEELTIAVYNITGQLVYSTKLEVNESQINLSILNKGVYFLQFSSENSNETRRLILK